MSPRLVCIVLVTLLETISSYAQFGAGTIVGTVRDASGSVIPGVEVAAREVSTGVETTVVSTDTGDYRFLNLPVGTYTLTVRLTGFKTAQKSNLRVVLGRTVTENFELQVGQVTETTTVTAELILDTGSSAAGVTRVLEEISGLPTQISGGPRNALVFLKTMAGISRGDTAQSTNWPTIQGVGDNGGFRGVAGVKIDGLNASMGTNQATAASREAGFEHQATAVPIMDVVQEFRVATNQDAEKGWDLGATIELVTKSGTNEFHGALFEYLRNDALDARNFFAAKPNVDKQHEFGGVVGGPIIRNKHFFLFSYDGYRRINAPGGLVRSVPTEKMRTGDFTEWLGPQIGADSLGRPVLQGQIFDPRTTRADGSGGFIRDPFPGNVIPAARLSPISTFFHQYLPAPTRPGTELNWVGSLKPGNTPRAVWNVKTDHGVGAHRLSVFFERAISSSSATDALRGFGWMTPEVDEGGPREGSGWRLRTNYLWTIRPNALFTMRVGVQRGRGENFALPESRTIGQQAGLKGTLDPGTPEVFPGRMSRFGNWTPKSAGTTSTIPVEIATSVVRDRHELKFGAEYLMVGQVQVQEVYTVGSFTFADRGTGLPGSLLQQTGNGYASFLLGEVDSAILRASRAQKYTSSSWGLYVQDKWRATPKLTINYGLRWDVHLTPFETYSRMASFDPSVPNPAAGGRLGALTFWGDGAGRNGRRRLIDTVFKNFGPRLGFVYQLDRQTVARAYYGIQYYPLSNFAQHGLLAPNFGWGANVTPATLNAGVTPAFNWNDGFPNLIPKLPVLDPSLANGSLVQFINPTERKVGSSQNLGFGLERQFPWNVVVRADYVGKLTHNIWTDTLIDFNQIDLKYQSLGNLLLADINSPQAREAGIPLPYAGFRGSVAQALRPYPQYLSIPQYNAMAADVLYHALELTVQKRLSHGLNFLLAYTISKNIHNDERAGRADAVPSTLQQTTQRNLAKRVDWFIDRPQVLNVSYFYELPFGRGKPFLSAANSFVQQLIGGWQLGAIHNYGSGTPVRLSTNASIPTIGPLWVNRVESVPVRTNVGCASYDPNNPSSRYLNIGAFATPAPFTLGDTRVLPDVRTCGYKNEDISIQKDFYINESIRVKFGAYLFNAFNRHDWENSSLRTNIDQPDTFGRYTAATPGRTIQLYLKLTF